MIGHLYRYSHPNNVNKFIYVGQGLKRDAAHRSGKSSFGRRFKRDFPGAELSQPVREVVEVKDQLELNELETIWMFQYHTWSGYDGGMNLIVPGSTDYKNFGLIQGRKNVESGHWASVAGIGRVLGGRIHGYTQGRKNVENGQLASTASIAGHVGSCSRWRIARNKPCVCGKHSYEPTVLVNTNC